MAAYVCGKGVEKRAVLVVEHCRVQFLLPNDLALLQVHQAQEQGVFLVEIHQEGEGADQVVVFPCAWIREGNDNLGDRRAVNLAHRMRIV